MKDFGYGAAKYNWTYAEQMAPGECPIENYSKWDHTKQKEMNPIFELPQAIAPDEVFVDINPCYAFNTGNRYIISNYGRVYDKDHERFMPYKYDKCNSEFNDQGYLGCKVVVNSPVIENNSDKVTSYENKDIRLHRAVAASFTIDEEDGSRILDNNILKELEANHINGIHSDCREKNVELVDPLYNKKHRIINNLKNNYLYSDPDENGNIVRKKDVIDNEEDAEIICKKFVEDKETIGDISSKYGYTTKAIRSVLSGNVFREVAQKYNLFSSLNFNLHPNLINYICKQLELGIKSSEIATEVGVNIQQIEDIRLGKLYYEYSKNYNINRSDNAYDTKTGRYFSREEIFDILDLAFEGNKAPTIAKKYNVNKTSIYSIIQGNSHMDIVNDYCINHNRSLEDLSRIYNDSIGDDLAKLIIQDMIDTDYPDSIIAKKYNVKLDAVTRIRHRKTYTHLSEGKELKQDARIFNKTKLSKDDVRDICDRLLSGESLERIAKDYNVYPSTIIRIKSGKSHKYITESPEFKNAIAELDKAKEEKIRNIVIDYKQKGLTVREIMEKYKMPKATVYKIVTGSRFRELTKDIPSQ